MRKTDPQYVKNRDSPLITYSRKYANIPSTSRPDPTYTLSKIPDQLSNKNTLEMGNALYTYQDDGTRPLRPKVEKSREKNLNIMGDQTGINSRYMTKETPQHAVYYIGSDKEDDISDTYYLHYKPLIQSKIQNPYDVVVNSDNLEIFPTCKKVPLSHELDNKNSRLIRNKKDLKDV